MKKFAVSICAVLFSCSALMAQSQVKNGTVTTDSEKGTYTLKVADLSMTISKNGGKILSFQNAGKEIISQSTRANAFGSTFWTSPQKEWNWPPVAEFDSREYQVEIGNAQSDVALTMTSQMSQKLKYVITKEFSLNAKSKSITVNYTITNKFDEVRQVAPWEITRVDNEGMVFFSADVDQITPGDLMDFQSVAGGAWFNIDSAPQNRKINSDGDGWLAYAGKDMLLIKKFQDITPDQPAPEEAEIQVYVNSGKTYVELESQGAYTTLKPGESFSWSVSWYLLPLEQSNAVPSKKLLKTVKKAIK